MNDKELEKILNFVLNNMGNREMLKLVELQETAQRFYLECSHKQSEIDEIKQVVRELRECVSFYSQSDCYGPVYDFRCDPPRAYKTGNMNDVIIDGGKRAREVLERNKEILGRVE